MAVPTGTKWVAAFVLALITCAACAAVPISGMWIWSSAAPAARNAHSYFRRSIALGSDPASATIHIAADSRYILFVNGSLVGRGSPRSFARYLYYDTWDVKPLLHRGSNVIAVHVLHYGETTGQYELGRPGLLLDAVVRTPSGTLTTGSDALWKAFEPLAWDTRLDPAGWNVSQFDDSKWPAATVIGPAGMAPWTDLAPTDIPPQRTTNVRPKAVADITLDAPPPDSAKVDFASVYRNSATASIGYATTYLYAPDARDVTLVFGSSEACIVWLNGNYAYIRGGGRISAVSQGYVPARLEAGWNRLLVKSVRIAPRWALNFAVTGPGAAGVTISSECLESLRDTWRVSPPYPAADPSGRTGIGALFPAEYAQSALDWTLVAAPTGPFDVVATQMRYTVRRHVPVPPVLNAGTLTTPAASAVFQTTADGEGSVLLDMGREVSGRTRITVSGANGGEMVDAGYGEATEFPDGSLVCPRVGVGILNPERDGIRYADRFICRPGDNTFVSFEKHAFRYLLIQVHHAPLPIRITGVSVDQETYPIAERGAFHCSDERLNRIWEMERYTLELNMEDSFTDCPWRERNQWVGDAAIEAPAAMYAFGDGALFRKLLVQGMQSQAEDGLVRGFFPTGWSGRTTRVPTYALMWIACVWDYYLYTGDATLLEQCLPVIDRQFAYLESHRDPSTGLIGDLPDWVFIDWAPGLDGQTAAVSGPLNCLYLGALRSAARVALACRDVVRATAYVRRAAELSAAVNAQFWDPSRGVYWDTLDRGPAGRMSQQMNALAINSGLADPANVPAIAARLVSDKSLTQIGTPYFASLLNDALHAAGRGDEAIAVLRSVWGRMVDWGSTTGWEGLSPAASLAHGWSAGPVRELPARYLGVRPTAPGWSAWEMSPAFCDLTSASGTVPTPHGDIVASWERVPGGLRVTVTVPAGTEARVRLPLAGLGSVRWLVNGSEALPDGSVRESAEGGWTICFRAAGVYTIEAAPIAGSPAAGTR